jgi:hypothetical protein
MSTWTIKESGSGKELGTIENKLRLVGSKITANGVFGHYTIEGDFGNHSFTIKKGGVKVSADIFSKSTCIYLDHCSRLLRLKRRAFIYMIPMVYMSMVKLIELSWFYLPSSLMKSVNIKSIVSFNSMCVCVRVYVQNNHLSIY